MGDWEARLFLGAIAAALIAGVGYQRRSLSTDGAIAALAVGTIVVTLGGWWWGLLVIVFFITSSALSHLRPTRGELRVVERGSRRDLVQVAANGGVATILAAGAGFGARGLLFAAFAGAIAAATADTWATELGRFSPDLPRSIVSGAEVTPGTSGGVTPLGTAASLAGACVIAAVAATGVALDAAPDQTRAIALFGTLAGAGFSAALIDSLLGATVQALYECPDCGQITEQPRHTCGARTVRVRGLPWVTNDVVNALATSAGAGIAALAVWIS